jgi:putative transposase
MCCRATGVDPKTVRRDQPPDNPEVREEMKAIASKRRRFGYRRIGVLLERKGMTMNHKKLYRLYTEEKLGVRRRRGRKRARGSRTPMPVALRQVNVGLWTLCPTLLARHASSACWP